MSMKQLLVITGSPGTGKSTLAKLLVSALGLLHIDLHELIESDSELSADFNIKKDCYDLNMDRVEKLVRSKLDANVGKVMVLDSHVAHLLPGELIIGVVVMKCVNLKVLEQRLLERNYSTTKIKENIDCEIFDVCLDEAVELGLPLLQIDSSVGIDEIIVVDQVKELLGD